MQNNPDFKEFFESFNTHKVRYVVVGAYAVMHHTEPRATLDIDVLVDTSPENARAVMAALTAFGFGSIGLTETDFSKPAQTVQLGYPPNRIDILTSITGVGFEEAYAHRQPSDYDGVPIDYLGVDQLLRNKEATARDKDLLDVKRLRKLRPS